MSLPAALLLIVLIVILLGNPIVGPRVVQDYGYGHWPYASGLIVAAILVFILLGGHLHFR